MNALLPSVLVVDDEKNMRQTLRTVLEDEGYSVALEESAERALLRLEKEEFLMVISDARLGGLNGYDFLSQATKRWPSTPFLMITAFATPRLAVEAIRAGAMDYLSKPFAPEELLLAISRCAERYSLLRENASLRARADEPYRLEHIIGDSPQIQGLRQMIETVAPSNATVLILGESGTGKELVAGALHRLSQRHRGAYVRINCAAIPENLLESELFGHEKGAFTGAIKSKTGRVEEADHGTIFLDEIGDMSRPLQAKLLRFLEDGSFTRVGGNEELRVDVRLIAATNRNLIEAIQEKQFREDLYHRLNVMQFRLPALRERGHDVLLLADTFLRHFNAVMKKHIEGISTGARQKLLRHTWPGNVRELRNVVERAVILETGSEVQPWNLPAFELDSGLKKGDAVESGSESLDELMSAYERRIIGAVLEEHHFNLSRTADQLKISRHALRYRMQRLQMGSVQTEDETERSDDSEC